MDIDAEKKNLILCPECGGTAVHRSKRRGLREWLMHWVMFTSPYRCPDCDKRFYRRRGLGYGRHGEGHLED